MNNDLTQLRVDIEPIIRKAGEILLSYFNTTVLVHKKQDGSIATTADFEAEIYLKKALGELVPDVSFNAEESGRQGASRYCFVIDPLDGTTNFSRGIGYFCISVCLTYDDKPLLGVIYQPILNEYFVAIDGMGAFFNDQKMIIGQKELAPEALKIVGLPYTKNQQFNTLLLQIRLQAAKSFVFRHFGASALDLAYVAAGRIDGAYFVEFAWWDVAAGILLVKEAGGKVADFEGKNIIQTSKTCLAGSLQAHSDLESLMNKAK